MFGADKMFKRQFIPCEGGYLFYPFAWSRGYLVTEEEFRQLCQDRKRDLSFIGMAKWLLPAALVGVLVIALAATRFEDERVGDIGTLGLGLLLSAVLIWKSTSAWRLVRDRVPIVPRRGKVERNRDMARIIGWPVMILLVLLSAWFVVLSDIIAYASPLIGVPLLALFGFACVRNIQLAWRKYSEGIRSP